MSSEIKWLIPKEIITVSILFLFNKFFKSIKPSNGVPAPMEKFIKLCFNNVGFNPTIGRESPIIILVYGYNNWLDLSIFNCIILFSSTEEKNPSGFNLK